MSLSFSSASADNWGTGGANTGQHPDVDPHSYCYEDDQDYSDLRTFVEHIAWNTVNPTEVDVNYHGVGQPDCILTGSSETDIVWQTWNLPAGTRGLTSCNDLTVSGQCDQNYLYMDLVEINIGTHDGEDAEKTACHEWGHSMGLTHGATDDCMINGERPQPNKVIHERYNVHHLGHINAWY